MERRQRSWPVRFELFKPTRFSKEESVMYYAHQWEAYQKSLHHDQQATAPADAVCRRQPMPPSRPTCRL
jgi:hypothetical protein